MGFRSFLENQKILSRAEDEITLDADFVWLSIIASVLAMFGIVLNNQYILIGAMLVAPFLDPIISFVSFLILRRWQESLVALGTLVFIFSLAIGSAIITYVVSDFLGWVPEQIAYIPNIGGAYFVVAVLIGIIGSLMWIWPKTSNTIAGLSIGISLVPPLANLGRAIAIWDIADLQVSLESVATNILGIFIGAFIILVFRPHS